jgi:hypothetical protein
MRAVLPSASDRQLGVLGAFIRFSWLPAFWALFALSPAHTAHGLSAGEFVPPSSYTMTLTRDSTVFGSVTEIDATVHFTLQGSPSAPPYQYRITGGSMQMDHTTTSHECEIHGEVTLAIPGYFVPDLEPDGGGGVSRPQSDVPLQTSGGLGGLMIGEVDGLLRYSGRLDVTIPREGCASYSATIFLTHDDLDESAPLMPDDPSLIAGSRDSSSCNEICTHSE